jgi:hypothetical protein
MQFVESQHTPRNTMLRAVRTGGPVTGGKVRKEYDELVAAWGLAPRLAVLLDGSLEGRAGQPGHRSEEADA